MNKYRVIVTDNKGSRFEKVYEIPEQLRVIDYLLDLSTLINDLSNSDIDIPNMNMEVYFESQIEIKDQESLNLELQEKLLKKELNAQFLKVAIFNSLNEIGLTYLPEKPLPLSIKTTILQLLSDIL